MSMDNSKESYCCPHCGAPTTGRQIGFVGKKPVMTMCQACEDYIGSPAAHQEGATMKNRIEMERLLKQKTGEQCK